jgi:small-conductance mechanosensitive channel
MEIEKRSDVGKEIHKSKKIVWLGSYVVVAAICIFFYVALYLDVVNLAGKYNDQLRKVFLASFFAVLVLGFSKFLEIIILKRSGSKYRRYNLIRLTKLLSILAVIMIVVSFLFANWYAAAVSLGLISLILGFALQTPISSFIGWMYIIIRNPYRIGDRIQIDVFKGDVIEIGYLDTTLWEFSGDYLTNDLPSGRLIRFPNTLVLQAPVYNYSWRNFNFIWNEIPFHVAYESDLNWVEQVIKKITGEELGEGVAEHINELKELVKDSPVADVQVKEYPFVSFRTNMNTWIEVTVTYLVAPKQAASVRSRIVKRIVTELLKEPDRVMFPKSNAR